jgi:hypothetical protein
MRALHVFACLIALALPASASAHGVGEPDTHGPDRAQVVDRGHEVPGPAGGAAGKPLAPAARARLKGADARLRLPTGWCGDARSTDNRENEFDNGVFRYHAIYALPSDAPDRFGQFASTIQADAFQASALLEGSYGRAIRFDLGTNCGPQYLDISVVRLPQTTAQLQALAPTPTGTLEAVSNGIHAAGFPTIRPNDTYESAAGRNRNFVVWLDGPTPNGACGQATSYADSSRDPANLNNLGGKIAVVFPNGSSGFCSSNTVRHEIGHNLGALQPVAPNAFDGAHCDDAYEDTMCYSQAPKVAGGQRGQFFDYGNDDYWDPPSGAPLPWWTANLNRFLCPDAACNIASSGGDTIVRGPEAGGGGDAGTEQAAPRAAKLSVKLKAKRSKKGWKVAVTARGEGSAVVTLRCRPKRRSRVKTVLSKETRLPRTLRATVRCATKPRAAVKQRATRV